MNFYIISDKVSIIFTRISLPIIIARRRHHLYRNQAGSLLTAGEVTACTSCQITREGAFFSPSILDGPPPSPSSIVYHHCFAWTKDKTIFCLRSLNFTVMRTLFAHNPESVWPNQTRGERLTPRHPYGI